MQEEDEDKGDVPGRSHWRALRWPVALVVFLFVGDYFVLPDIAVARKSIHRLEHVNIPLLLLGTALEAASLIAYAELTRTVLSPRPPSRFTLLRINMSSLSVSHVIPGGTAPGTALAYRLLVDEGIPGSTAGTALATQGIGSALVLNGIFWLALVISIPLSGYNRLYGFAALIGVFVLAIFAGTVLLLIRGRAHAADYLRPIANKIPFVNPDTVLALLRRVADRLRVLLEDRTLLTHATAWAAANWMLDAASLWVFLLAFGHVTFPVYLLVAYGLANILGVIPITPGGLGIVTVVAISSLVGFHVTDVVATLAVLGWRLVNFWLPIPLGGLSYLSLQLRPKYRPLS